MRPGSGDKQYRILIAGPELRELKRLTWGMVEAFGLDRRIEGYQGKRPLSLYRWDLDCLEEVTASALGDAHEYPEKSGARYKAMKHLHDRIKWLRARAYADIGED